MSATLSSPFGGDVAALQEATRDETTLRRFLHGLPGVDQVGAEARAAALATRSIKTTSKAWALDAAVRMVDLTTLEGADTPGKVRSLCAKAMRPDPSDPTTPAVAAVCVYPDLVGVAVEALRGSEVQGRERRDGVPSGRGPRGQARRRARGCRGRRRRDRHGDRPRRFPGGRYGLVLDEIVADARACGPAHLKVILETGELATLDNVRRASVLALLAGADFIKTSTGKVSPPRRRPWRS